MRRPTRAESALLTVPPASGSGERPSTSADTAVRKKEAPSPDDAVRTDGLSEPDTSEAGADGDISAASADVLSNVVTGLS